MANSVTLAVPDTPPRIVIVGAGFAGLFCAKGLVGANAKVTLIDRQNHHLFQPLLYQVATGFLGVNDVALPVRSLFKAKNNIEVVMGEVTGVDTAGKHVLTADKSYPYDYLVLAPGARYHFFGHDAWGRHVLVLKTLEDAIHIRQRVLSAFEQAEKEDNPAKRRQLLSFIIIGGGPTGVETAGAIADVVNYALTREFRHIRPEEAHIFLIEAAPQLLRGMPEPLAYYTKRVLLRKRVIVQCSTAVEDIREGEVVTSQGSIKGHTVIWAAGVRPLPVAEWLGKEPDARGGMPVGEDFSVNGLPNVFVLGDAATYMQDGKPLPALASVAKQQGKYLARYLRRHITGRKYKPFRYRDWGIMATIGRNEAVADFNIFTLKGRLAWLAWGLVHIYFLTGFRNRMAVFLTWVWTYLTYGMGARILIRQEHTEEE